MKRVLVCGGRNYGRADLVAKILNQVRKVHGIEVIIHGLAPGADALAAAWAFENNIPQAAYAADWRAHGRAAGPLRNQRMLDEGKPDLVFAFPGGRGTEDMKRRARAAKVVVLTVADENAADLWAGDETPP